MLLIPVRQYLLPKFFKGSHLQDLDVAYYEEAPALNYSLSFDEQQARVTNIELADGTFEGMSIQKNLVSSFGGVNVEEKILRKCVELFEGGNVVESPKRKCKFSFKNRWIVTSIPGAWSEADEIVILKGMIYFAAKKKKASPIEYTGAFHDFIMEFLHINPSRQQLSAKIKELKERYERNKVQK